MAKILSFLVSIFIFVSTFSAMHIHDKSRYSAIEYSSYIKDTILEPGSWFLYIPGGIVIYGIIGDFITGIFSNILNKRSVAQYEKKQELQRIREQDREIERKRRELEIEFEHLQRIMMLQANIDQGKLNALQDMQNNLKSQKMSDLDTLRQQIESMKRG